MVIARACAYELYALSVFFRSPKVVPAEAIPDEAPEEVSSKQRKSPKQTPVPKGSPQVQKKRAQNESNEGPRKKPRTQEAGESKTSPTRKAKSVKA